MIRKSGVRSGTSNFALVLSLAIVTATGVRATPAHRAPSASSATLSAGKPLVQLKDPCTLEISADPKFRCKGLLNMKDLLAAKTAGDRWTIVYPVRNAISEDESQKRKLYDPDAKGLKCRGKDKQRATAWYNDDSRRFNLKALKKNQGVLMGAIKFLDGCPGDHYYKGAGEALDKDDVNRRLLVIAWHDDALTTHEQAWYQLYQVTGEEGARSLEPVGVKKLIDYCDHLSNADIPAADFNGCPTMMAAGKIARSYGLSATTVLDAARCDPEVQRGCITSAQIQARVKQLGVLSGARLKEFVSEVARLAARQEPETDPFWFTCGAGCCTATM